MASGHKGRKYQGAGFAVAVEPIIREDVRVVYVSEGKTLDLDSEYIGEKWHGINVTIPAGIGHSQAETIAQRLVEALTQLGFGFVISYELDIEIVSEAERKNAIAELREIGYGIEVLADGAIRTRLIRTPNLAPAPLKEKSLRMIRLIQAVHGKRHRFQILAKSEEF